MAEFTNIKINDVKYDVRDAGAARASDLATKQDVISDLSAIRSGASKGATAIQQADLAAVATSGSYNDLQDKPNIPDIDDAKPLVVTITSRTNGNNTTYSLDNVTFNQMVAAYNAGKDIICDYDRHIHKLSYSDAPDNTFFFTSFQGDEGSYTCFEIHGDNDISKYSGAVVPTTRTVNGKALSSNITLSASDVGALPNNTHIPADQVQSNWNETNTSSKAYIQNKPTIPAAQVNSDWDASSGVAQILNKPTFKTINGQSLVGSGNITVVGEKGDKGDTGNVTVTDGVAQITIVNDLTTGGTGDALSAEMGKYLGQTALVGMGTFAQAYVKSQSNHDLWCWMLNDMVDGEVIRKPIWHVGSSTFVDAVGSVVSIAIAPPAEPVFSLDDSEDVLSGSTLNVTFFGTLHYIIDGGVEQTTSTSPLALTLNADTDIEAWVEDSIGLLSQHVTKSYTIAVDHKLQFKIALTGDNSTEYIPVKAAGGPRYTMTVDWGDGNTDTFDNRGFIAKQCSHTYSGSAGTEFTVTIRGSIIPHLQFGDNNLNNKAALVEVIENTLTCSTELSYGGCSNLRSLSADALSNNNSTNVQFMNCTSLMSLPDGLLSHLSSNLTSCSNLFRGCNMAISSAQMAELKSAIGNCTSFAMMFHGFRGTAAIPDDLFDNVQDGTVTSITYMFAPRYGSSCLATGHAKALYDVLVTKMVSGYADSNVKDALASDGLYGAEPNTRANIPSTWGGTAS